MQQSEYRTVLTDRKTYLQTALQRIEDALDEQPSQDVEDRATEREDDEVMERLGTAEMAELRQIDGALARLDAGTFGICVQCADQISDARLQTLPHTPLCRTCAAAL